MPHPTMSDRRIPSQWHRFGPRALSALLLTAAILLAGPLVRSDATSATPTPSGLTAVSRSRSAIAVTWSAVKGAPKYRIQLSRSSSMKNATYHRFNGTRAELKGLRADTTYYVKVRVITKRGGNLSPYSRAIRVRTRTSHSYHYLSPADLHSTGAGPTSIGVAWSNRGPGIRYRVQYARSPSMSGADYFRTTPTGLTLAHLRVATPYWLKVRVIDRSGKNLSDYSPAIKVTTLKGDLGGQPCPESKRVVRVADVAALKNSGYPVGTELFVPDAPDPWGGCFPGPKTTGIQPGVKLTKWTGACEVRTDNAVVEGKLIIGCDTFYVDANNVVMKNIRLIGPNLWVRSGNLTITDSEADFGPDRDGQGFTGSNITAKRLDFHGGHRQMWCDTCTVEDSYFHDQNISGDLSAHASAVRTDHHTVYRHNTIRCDLEVTSLDGGCSAPQTGYPDFGPIYDNTVDKNLIMAAQTGYCSYGGWNPGKPYNDDQQNATNIQFSNNVVARGTYPNDDPEYPLTDRHRYTCGYWGPVTSYADDNVGYKFYDNRWDDGLLWRDDPDSPRGFPPEKR